MGVQYFRDPATWVTTSGTAVANTTTETIVFPAFTVPANTYQNGRHVYMRSIGQYSTTATPTLIFSVRQGGVAGTLICKTAASTLPTITAGLWIVDVLIGTRTNGSAGTVMGNGYAAIMAGVAGTVASATGAGLITPLTNGGVLAPATATFDLTANSDLVLTATWSAASASNTLTGLNHLIEYPN